MHREVRTNAATQQPGPEERTANGPSPTAFSIRGPATTSWREQALGRAAEYRFLARLLVPQATEQERQALDAIERHLDAAERAAAGHDKRWNGRSPAPGEASEASLGRWGRVKSFFGGAAVERANSQLDAVETDLLRLARDPYLRGQIPNLLAATRAASLEARHEIRRVRSFRNVLLVTAFILTLGVAGLTVLGASSPDRVPLCFAPDNAMVVCPTDAQTVETPNAPAGGDDAGVENPSPDQQVHIDERIRDTARSWDIPVVEIVGLLAAALAAAFALRSIEGTSTPYSLPVAAAVLKLPTGALTAVFGLLLMRGGFIPGLSALDSSAQIIAWAIVFGYSQQLLTRFVDQQANTVLQKVGTPTNPQLAVPTGQPPPQRVQPQKVQPQTD